MPQLSELGYSSDGNGIVVGGGVTFAGLLEFLPHVIGGRDPKTVEGLGAMEAHLRRIANQHVRAVATVGGNLVLARRHANRPPPAPSDFSMVAATVGAVVVVRTPDQPDEDQTCPVLELLATDRFTGGVVVTKILIPFTSPGTHIQTYRVARRFQNSYAIVNAGFFVQLDAANTVVEARILLGGVASVAAASARTADALVGMPWTKPTFEAALAVLSDDIDQLLAPNPYDSVSPAYRKALALSFFYKCYLRVALLLAPDTVPAADQSAAVPFARSVSSGAHEFVEAPYYDGEPVAARTARFSLHPGTPDYRQMRLAAVPLEVRASVKAESVAGVNLPDGGTLDRPLMKSSAPLQATGEARYTHDEPGPINTLHAAFVISHHRNARFDYGGLSGLADLVAGLRLRFPGFRGYITAADIPAGPPRYDETRPANYDPVFAAARVTSYSQPIGLAVADSQREAELIAAEIQNAIHYDADGLTALTTVEAAVAEPGGRGLLSGPSTLKKIRRPGSDPAWLAEPAQQDNRVFVTGTQRTGAQAHFYLETQATLAVPGEDGQMTIYTSAQNLASCQGAVARALKLPANAVEARVARLGGGFGGKELRPPYIAAAAAVAAWTLQAPVRLALDRNTDMAMIGKRHPFKGTHYLSADATGRIEKLRLDYLSDGGSSFDCSLGVMELVLLSADDAYQVNTFEANGLACYTNIETRTAFRSFGVMQCVLILEEAIEHLAHELGMLPEDVRQANFYRDATLDSFDVTPYGQDLRYSRMRQVWDDLAAKSDFKTREQAVRQFNHTNRWRKRGISMIPLKYGISYTSLPSNQGSADIVVYRDGSVLVHHGGIEMGQGIDTKILRIAADALGIDIGLIRIAPADTATVPNASSTGASTGTDLAGGAVNVAGRQLRDRLSEFCTTTPSSAYPDWQTNWAKCWKAIVSAASAARLDLSSQASYASPLLGSLGPDNQLKPGQQMFYYFTYSGAVSEVEIDVLTGESTIIRLDLIYDAGQSLNSAIDFGQIEGGFVQGVGNVTTEEIFYADDGKLIPDGTWKYKPPCSKTIPEAFNVGLLEYVRTDLSTNAPMDHYGIQSSKTTGEPPLVLASSVFFAIKHAILAARSDVGDLSWFELESPATVERIRQACLATLV